MFFYLRNKNKKISQLRKNIGYTAKELSIKLGWDTVDVLKIDDKKLKDISDKKREILMPIFKGNK